MARVTLQFSLDLTAVHDKLVYDLLADLPDARRRDFVVSAALYYSKSPSFLTETKMGEYLERLDKLAAVFTGPAYEDLMSRIEGVAALKDHLIDSVSSSVSDRIEETLEGMDLTARKGKKNKATEQVPEDAMAAMSEQFST